VAAVISFTALLPVSPTKTFPLPSKATPWGALKPLPAMLCAPGPNAICGPEPVPDSSAVTIAVPELFNNWTAPYRVPGCLGLKVTLTVQVSSAT
jgi:hypothetical protein